jgi:uncharacterized repeat protein (TIGR03803 family)
MTSPTVADAFGDLFSVSNDGSSVLELTNVGTVAAPIYSSAPNILATFNALITGGLTVDAHGDVLGATGPDYSTNPPRNYGALFEIKNLGAAAAPVFATSPTTLYAFPTRGFGGANPIGGMVLDAKGDLFGATLNGGLYGDGTVFEIKNLGGLDAPNYATAPTTLFTFIGGDDNGAHPISLAADSNGVLYGATASGGTFRSADVTVTQVVNGITHTYPHMSVGTGFVVPIAPVIAGTVSGQGTAGGPVTPFAGVTIGDANPGATDTLTITLGGDGGTLSGAGLMSAGPGAGRYVLSGAARDITRSLDALVFTPPSNAAQPFSTTTFTLSDASSAGGAATTDSTTTVINTRPIPAPASLANFDAAADILLQNDNGQTAVWDMNGATLTGGGALTSPGAGWSAVSSSVVHGDSDILWQNSDGQVALWGMNGSDPSTIGNLGHGGGAMANPGPSWHALDTGDFNADGLADILLQNSNGQAAIWETNGGGVIGGGAVGANPGASWRAVGAGDFNDDGHSDILWQNANGQAAVWEMDGTKVIGGGAVAQNPGASWHEVGSGDFNADGHADILWQNASGQVSVWEMNGNTLIGGGSVANPGASWKAMGTGDYNHDGHSDILLQNTGSGQISIWDMNGNDIIGGGVVAANAGASWHVKA